jgi:hypothetical protein
MSSLDSNQQIVELYQTFIRSVHKQAWNILKEALQVQQSANSGSNGNEGNNAEGPRFLLFY